MKSRFAFAVAAVLSIGTAWVVAQETLPQNRTSPGNLPAAPRTDARHYSYAIGLDLGSSFGVDQVELDVDRLVAGIRDGMQKAAPKYSPEVCAAALQQLDQLRLAALKQRNEQFLVQNQKADGVQTLPSGLQIQVLQKGGGDKSPGPDSTVRVHYRGQRVDGSVFDQTIGGEPAQFRVNQVIPGWTEALQKMHVGDRWRLFVPASLAYGDDGFGDVIPPHSTLIFEVELLDVL
ncbi:MAG: FKBP-type peptidyl-prolyl cis-trans isomerase [Planctomycetales bacterium]|nr:FKBP-type peptidyl-prolyl cis-trans isomerase [Planctomycetales bacterium]